MPDDHVFVFSQTPLVAEMHLSIVGAVEATFRMVRTLRDTVGSWTRGPAVFDPSHKVHYSAAHAVKDQMQTENCRICTQDMDDGSTAGAVLPFRHRKPMPARIR